jgi:hypothetical protein
MDLDATTVTPGLASTPTAIGGPASVVSRGRLRGATLVSIAAFDGAKITLSDGPSGSTGGSATVYTGVPSPHEEADCGCHELNASGVAHFAPSTTRQDKP